MEEYALSREGEDYISDLESYKEYLEEYEITYGTSTEKECN